MVTVKGGIVDRVNNGMVEHYQKSETIEMVGNPQEIVITSISRK